MIALLLACATRAPLFASPIPDASLPTRAPVAVAEGACAPEPVAPGWVADCRGVVVAVEDLERAELLEADLQLARRLLLEQVTARAVERAHAEDQHAEAVRALRRAQVRVALVEIGVAVVVVGAVVSAVR